MQIIHDICDKNLPNALANSSNQAGPQRHNLNFILCPLKANTQNLKNTSRNRNEPKECIQKWQHQTRQSDMPADNSGNHADP